jgi:hypothetical protein
MAPRRDGADPRASAGKLTKQRRDPVKAAAYPFSAGRIFELGWSLFTYGWRRMYGALLVCLAPAYAVTIVVELFYGQRLQAWLADAAVAAQQGVPRPDPPPGFATDVAANALAAVTLFIASLIGSAAVVAIVDDGYRGSFVTARRAVRGALSTLPALIYGQLLYLIGVAVVFVIGLIVAAVLFLVGGLLTFIGVIVLVGDLGLALFYAVRASLTTVVVVTEQAGGAAALARSWRLVADNGWRVFGYLVLVALLGTAVSFFFAPLVLLVFPFATGSLADAAARTVIGIVPALVLAPLAPILLTLLYFDLRWRHGERVPLPGGGETDGRPRL